MMEASAVPIARMAVLSLGEPCKEPHTRMPPDTVYKENSSTMKGMYSANSAWTISAVEVPRP